MLSDDPNNERAFRALAEIVRRRAAESSGSTDDPLAAEPTPDERERAADLAVWALGEELAGNPRAWYPLIEIARLSVRDDHEGTLRRLTTAVERDPSGKALVDALTLLRGAGLPVDALGLGVGHWHPRDHDPEVARQLVLAAIEAGRPLDAKQHIMALDLYPDQAAVAGLRTELAHLVAEAEQTIPGT
ncbi:hypothetical protein Cch01nite_05700 [Cellulomonas chitinilytica]|uniref:Uncharacterized protein n=2 Tax=Cellulomonas chitinilytica TaxID=398759 RepID=A0A919P1B9_9CELL|nr:hypothetical protein Cch01nite_05700 [Cellulomonas chitinilytica]